MELREAADGDADTIKKEMDESIEGNQNSYKERTRNSNI